MIATTPSALHPLNADAIAVLAESLSGATVVGIGESTRFSHETFSTRELVTRALIKDHGFRTLAVQDTAGVGAAIDRYVSGGDGSGVEALGNAWRPWRTEEMVGALDWVREFNRENPDDRVRVIGVKPVLASVDDYDVVLDAVRVHAPERLAEVAAHLDPIRTAHVLDEHVQRAQGVHPGRPFVEQARDAAALVARVPEVGESVLARMDSIVEYHAHSVAGRGSYAGEAELWAETIVEDVERTGARAVYWDGISHVSAAPSVFGLGASAGSQATVGSVLRARFGNAYASVAIGFHHGDLGVANVPAPAADFLDAALGDAGLPELWVDLRTDPMPGPAKLRVISGVYDPVRDADEHLGVSDLPEAFDVLVHIREVSAVRWLTS